MNPIGVMTNKKPSLVLVEWDDAYSNSMWHSDSEVDAEFHDYGWECVTVGYLIRETKTGITLAARASFTNKSWGLLQRIPRGMVKKITRIKV